MTTDVDIIEILERDHHRMADLAEQLDSVSDSDAIHALYRQIVDGLLAHEAIEQEVLFPAFREMLASRGEARLEAPLEERLDEHDELNELLAEMRDLDSDGFAFMKRGSALLLEMERHFELEEESVFAPMREQLPSEMLVELGRRALARDTSA